MHCLSFLLTLPTFAQFFLRVFQSGFPGFFPRALRSAALDANSLLDDLSLDDLSFVPDAAPAAKVTKPLPASAAAPKPAASPAKPAPAPSKPASGWEDDDLFGMMDDTPAPKAAETKVAVRRRIES